MKLAWLTLGFAFAATFGRSDTLPVITSQPHNLSGAGTFSVVSTNATGFQWRWNGTDIPGATNSILARNGSDPTGYYMVAVKNATGWVPSQLAYLSRGSGGYVPFSNYGNTGFDARACYQINPFGWGNPLTNGIAQVIAGPELDQMQPVGDAWDFWDWYYYEDPGWAGYFDGGNQIIPTVSPGQTVYYRVDLTYPGYSGSYTQQSTTLKLTAGGGSYPIPSMANLKFPLWPEWPEPWNAPWVGSTATNQVRIPGETVSLTNFYEAYTDFGIPACQWRKDGKVIPGATNLVQIAGDRTGGYFQAVLSITNIQPADAGIYDVEVFGNQWIIAPTITLTVQITNGPGLLLSPHFADTNFVCDLIGVASRNYQIQWSPDLQTWNDLLSVSNATGTVTFTNSSATDAARFYRARLLP